jgi:hypothetical protein
MTLEPPHPGETATLIGPSQSGANARHASAHSPWRTRSPRRDRR